MRNASPQLRKELNSYGVPHMAYRRVSPCCALRLTRGYSRYTPTALRVLRHCGTCSCISTKFDHFGHFQFSILNSQLLWIAALRNDGAHKSAGHSQQNRNVIFSIMNPNFLHPTRRGCVSKLIQRISIDCFILCSMTKATIWFATCLDNLLFVEPFF